MSLSILKKKSIRLPEPETPDGISAQDIIHKINSFITRSDLAGPQGEFLEADFLELLVNYPKSMCNHHLGDKLQLLIALIYLDGCQARMSLKNMKTILANGKRLHGSGVNQVNQNRVSHTNR